MEDRQKERIMEWISNIIISTEQETNSNTSTKPKMALTTRANEVLVLMCPLCETTRFATRKKWQVDAFKILTGNSNKYNMRATILVSLCARHENMYETIRPTTNKNTVMNMAPFEYMTTIVSDIRCGYMTKDEDEVRILTPDQTNDLCTKLYMVPILLTGASIEVLPYDHITDPMNRWP